MITKLCVTLSSAAALSSFAQPAFCVNEGFAEQATSGLRKMFAGVASYYADKFNGRRTASGARSDMNKMTCAHKFLPFGTQLVIKNLTNGKTCTVTVTDRGPFCKGRVLDLSKAAACKIGMTGTAHVEAYQANKNTVAPPIVATLPLDHAPELQPAETELAPATTEMEQPDDVAMDSNQDLTLSNTMDHETSNATVVSEFN